MHHTKGLSSTEAEQLLAKYGRNELETGKKTSALTLFLNQFKSFLLLLLIVAAFVSFVAGDKVDSLFIILIVILNAFLGFVQEYKAENAIAALKNLTISKVRVFRDGVEHLVDTHLLVPGDTVKVESGDKIPADGIVLVSRNLEINEAALTGESLPVTKTHTAGENSVSMGTIVTDGSGILRISETGKNTKFGQLASSLTTIQEQKTPLEKKIAALAKQLSFAAIGITIIIFILGILQDRPLMEMVFTSISLAVAAVPEGLPAVITIALAVGLQRMARRKAVLRKLGAIEALGNTTVIVTDKTGTLTENKMRVVKAEATDKKELIKAGIICNNAALVLTPDKKPEVIGEQTEGSLLLYAHEQGFSIDDVKKQATIVQEYSFDQTRKIMSMLVQDQGKLALYTKGAPESILSRSTGLSEKKKK
jgi:P-type Ca2+ transporter type 2C